MSSETGRSAHSDIIPVPMNIPSDETPLETTWTFWYDKRSKDPNTKWEENLRCLGSFGSIEGFWQHYFHLQRPSQMEKEENLYCFRGKSKPMWENWPQGGVWLRKFKRNDDSGWFLDKRWEQLLIATIGEQFQNPDVVGVAFSSRMKEDVLALWNRDQKDPRRFQLGSKLKEVIQLEPHASLEYKDHETSIKDNSTYRNSVVYKLE